MPPRGGAFRAGLLAAVAVSVLNRMLEFGCPESVRVA